MLTFLETPRRVAALEQGQLRLHTPSSFARSNARNWPGSQLAPRSHLFHASCRTLYTVSRCIVRSFVFAKAWLAKQGWNSMCAGTTAVVFRGIYQTANRRGKQSFLRIKYFVPHFFLRALSSERKEKMGKEKGFHFIGGPFFWVRALIRCCTGTETPN